MSYYSNPFSRRMCLVLAMWSLTCAVVPAGLYAVLHNGRTPRGYITKVSVDTMPTSLLVYSSDPRPGDITVDCTHGQYVLPRGDGQRFWIVELSLAWNHCIVNREIFTWPTFEYVDPDADYAPATIETTEPSP